MARKCTTGFHWSVHFMREDISIKIEITTDEFVDVRAMKNFLEETEETTGKTLTLQEAVDALYDFLRGYYSIVTVKGFVEDWGDTYAYEVN